MAGIAVAGNALVDHYKRIEAYPAASALTTITSITTAPGGLLCNCAIDLARLAPDLRIAVVGVIGDDPAGDYLTAELRRHRGIDTGQLHRSGTTSFTDVMEDAGANTRTFFHFRGANAQLGPEHFDFSQLDADLLHIGYVLLLDALDEPDAEFGTRLARVLAAARTHGMRTSLDVVSEYSDRYPRLVPPALRFTDYCVLNEFEASRTTGIELSGAEVSPADLRRAAEALLGMGVSTWVVIHWPGGAAGLSATGEWVVRPALEVSSDRIMTTTGAGDAFAAGVVHTAWAGGNLAEAIETGIGAATSSLLAGNATDGVPTAREALARYRSWPRRPGTTVG